MTLWEANDATRRRAIFIVLAVAVLVRLLLLGSKSLWFDEAFSVIHSQQSLELLWAPGGPRPESHPPLYYTLLHYWMLLTGTSETAVRLPSAFVSTANVGLLYLLGRRLLLQPGVALLAAALLALSPLNIWYAQEARMYVFVTMSGLLFALLLLWDSWAALPMMIVTLVLGLYIDYTMLPLWAGLSALWLVWWWVHERPTRPLVNWLLGSLLAGLLFLPWRTEFVRVINTFYDIHIFEQLQQAIGLPILSPTGYLLAMLVGAALLIPAAAVLLRLVRRDRTRSLLAGLILALFFVATVLFPLPRLYGIKRLLVLVWPYAILLAAWSVSILPRKRVLTGIALSVSLLATMVTILVVPKDDWRGAVAYINQQAAPDALVIFDPYWNEILGRYYELQPEQLRAREPIEAGMVGRETWLIAERFPGQAVPSSAAETALDAAAALQEAAPFYRLEVRRYSP